MEKTNQTETPIKRPLGKTLIDIFIALVLIANAIVITTVFLLSSPILLGIIIAALTVILFLPMMIFASPVIIFLFTVNAFANLLA